MKITFLTAEASPFASTGSLGDVIAALASELLEAGHEVTVMMPLYSNVRVRPICIMSPLRMQFAGKQLTYSILEAEHKGVRFIFVDATQYFSRAGLYADDLGEFRDNDERFLFFTRACLDYYERKDTRPDILHANDWPTAMTALYLKTHYEYEAIHDAPVLFTIHDNEYQGIFSKDRYHLLDIGWEYFTSEGIEFYDSVNFLKAGIVFSDVLTTVSNRYAREIQTPEHGYRLDGILRSRKEHLHGILNGIDDRSWNPATDEHIAVTYSAEDPTGKQECRRALLRELGWDVESTQPIICMVSRLATEKGFDLLEAASGRLIEMDSHIVVLGSGAARYEGFLKDWAARVPEKVSVNLQYEEGLARRIHAGSDMLLMPSRHEPCGLQQMYALRYGTVPIVRATGGLDDSVEEWNATLHSGNGFKFADYKSGDMLDAVQRAVSAFKDHSQWLEIVRNGMGGDYSWRGAAQQYLQLYNKAIRLKS